MRGKRDGISRFEATESLHVPEGSESQKTKKKKKRSTQKCDACAERKLRCILKKPNCRKCEMFGLACSFSGGYVLLFTRYSRVSYIADLRHDSVGKADDPSRYEDKFCDRCRRKGTSCSGPPKPECNHCHESGRECSFQRRLVGFLAITNLNFTHFKLRVVSNQDLVVPYCERQYPE